MARRTQLSTPTKSSARIRTSAGGLRIPWLSLAAWGAAGMVIGVGISAFAEQITLTTYYSSPREVFQELRTTNNANLAIAAGTVGIGTNAPDATQKLHVVGDVVVTGNVRIQPPGIPPAAGYILISTDALGSAAWSPPPPACTYGP